MSPVSRRTLLQAGALTLFANALTAGLSLSSADPLPMRTSAAGRAGCPDPVGASSGSQFTPPYSVGESSVLSEDYFLTDQVILGADDVVKAFRSPDGYVEALVAQNGTLFHLRKDASATSGWTYEELTGQDGGLLTGVTDIAVGIDVDGYSWAVVITDNGTNFAMMTQDGTGAWQYYLKGFRVLPSGPVGEPIGPLKSAYDSDGSIYFTAFSRTRPGVFLVWDPNSIDEDENNPFFEISALAGKDIGSSPVVLWSDTVPTAGAGVLGINSTGTVVWYPQLDGTGTYGDVQTFTDVHATSLLWADCGTAANPGPRYLTLYGTFLANYAGSTLQQIALLGADGVAQAAVWQNATTFTVAAIDLSSTLNVLSMYGINEATPLLPIAADIQAVSSYPSDPNDATLFVTDVAGVLSVMTKSTVIDPVSGTSAVGWTTTPVQQVSATAQEIDCYRSQLTVIDANGVPVAGTTVQLTPDRAVGLWQPGGHIIVDPTHPVTLTTDNFGRVTFAIPAGEIDSALFTAQFFENDALTGDPVPVNPAVEVHAFLAGSAPLNNLGTIDGPALVAAKNAAGQPVFPVLANLSGSDQSSASTGVASAVNQCMIAGQAGTPGPSDPQSFKLDMSGPVPTYSSSTDPNNFGALLGGSGWWDDAKRDAESVYHGIRHGLVKVSQCIATYASDVKQWTVNLAINIGDDVNDVVSYVITDIRSAIHAVSGFFQTLGADIKDAIHWLKMFVTDLFKDAEANAQTVLGWLHAYPTQLDAGLTTFAGLADGAFTALENRVNTSITGTVLPATAGVTMSGAGTTEAEGLLGADLSTVVSDVRHNWLFEKVFAELDLLAVGGGSDETLGGLLLTAVEEMLPTKLVGELAAALWTVMADTVKAAADMKGFSVNTLLTVLQGILGDILAYLDGVMKASVALMQGVIGQVGAFLDTNMLDQIPLVGGILTALGIDADLTAGHLFCLIAMFPTTLVYMATTGSDSGLMFQTVGFQDGTDPDDPYAVGTTKDPMARDLLITHGVVRTVLGIFDVLVDASVFLDDQAPPDTRMAPLKIMGLLDAIFTMLLQVVVYPGKKNADGSVAPPCSTPPDVDLDTALGWMVLSKMILGALNPLIGITLQLAKIISPKAKYSTWWPISRGIMAAINLGLGITIDVEKKAIATTYAAQTIEMANLIISPFVAAVINNENLAIPLAVKGVGDLCQSVAGGLYLEQASQMG